MIFIFELKIDINMIFICELKMDMNMIFIFIFELFIFKVYCL